MHPTPEFMQRQGADTHDAGQIMHAVSNMLGSGALMIEPGYLSATLAAVESGNMSWFTGRWDPQNRLNVTDDGIAICRVHGLLLARGAWLGSIWGATSYEGLAEQFKRIGNDPAIRQVILDIDSGGGMAAGIWDLMPVLDALKEKKQVTAVANPFCASAAYAIGCAAHSLFVNRGATTGSIGVVRPHMDMSAALEKWGIRPTLFTAGRMKAAGNPYEALTPEVRGYIQAGVDKTYGEFVGHVAKYRGMSEGAVRGTEARVYDSADAVDLGLADGVMSFEEVLDHVRSSPKARSRANTPTGGRSMTTPSGVSLSKGDLESLTSSLAAALQPKPAVAAAPASETVSRVEADRMAADAADKAVKADRERMSAVLALPEAKGNEGYALKLALKGMSADEAKDLLADLPKADAKSSGFNSGLAAEMAKAGNSAGVKPEAKSGADAGQQSPTAGMQSLGETMTARFGGMKKTTKRS